MQLQPSLQGRPIVLQEQLDRRHKVWQWHAMIPTSPFGVVPSSWESVATYHLLRGSTHVTLVLVHLACSSAPDTKQRTGSWLAPDVDRSCLMMEGTLHSYDLFNRTSSSVHCLLDYPLSCFLCWGYTQNPHSQRWHLDPWCHCFPKHVSFSDRLHWCTASFEPTATKAYFLLNILICNICDHP